MKIKLRITKDKKKIVVYHQQPGSEENRILVSGGWGHMIEEDRLDELKGMSHEEKWDVVEFTDEPATGKLTEREQLALAVGLAIMEDEAVLIAQEKKRAEIVQKIDKLTVEDRALRDRSSKIFEERTQAVLRTNAIDRETTNLRTPIQLKAQKAAEAAQAFVRRQNA